MPKTENTFSFHSVNNYFSMLTARRKRSTTQGQILCPVMWCKSSVHQAFRRSLSRQYINTRNKKRKENALKLLCKQQNGKLDGKILQNQGVMEIPDSKEPTAKTQFTYKVGAVLLRTCQMWTVYRIRQLQHSQCFIFWRQRFTANRNSTDSGKTLITSVGL